MTINAFDCEELLGHILGVDLNSDDYESLLEQKLFDEFNIGTEDFAKLMDRIVPFIGIGEGIGGSVYKGFSIPVEGAAPGVHQWLLKIKA